MPAPSVEGANCHVNDRSSRPYFQVPRKQVEPTVGWIVEDCVFLARRPDFKAFEAVFLVESFRGRSGFEHNKPILHVKRRAGGGISAR